jgi:hypothetical protein
MWFRILKRPGVLFPETTCHMPVRYILGVALFFVFSCGPRQPEVEVFTDPGAFTQEEVEQMAAKTIFYDIYSPVEAYKVFQAIGAVFDLSIPNPLTNIDRYTTIQEKVVNLGVYGADLSYCRMFGQTQETINYLSLIYRISEDLGIPSELYTQNKRKLERSISNPDSLFNIASRIYVAADKYFKQTDEEGYAALILTGGWVEAMYIATSFHSPDRPDPVLANQLALQKYSLNRLIAHLGNLEKDPVAMDYLTTLRQLKRVYDRFEIFFEMNDLRIDTLRKEIHTSGTSTSIRHEDVNEIKEIIDSIRSRIVS